MSKKNFTRFVQVCIDDMGFFGKVLKIAERSAVAEYLKIPEVAQRLDVSEKTARRYVKTGELPSVFLGGAYRVSEEDLEKYLEAAKVAPGDGSGKVQAPLPLEDGPAGPPSPQAPDTQPEEERRQIAQSWIDGLQEYFSARAEKYNREVQNPQQSPHFRDTNAAALWVAQVEKEAAMLRDWLHDHAYALLPLGPGERPGQLGGQKLILALDLFRLPLGLDDAAERGKRFIQEMPDTPDDPKVISLTEKVSAQRQESRKRLDELRPTADG